MRGVKVAGLEKILILLSRIETARTDLTANAGKIH